MNLFQRTEELGNAYWSKIGGSAVTDNAFTDPNGGSTADSIDPTTTDCRWFRAQTLDGSAHTLSIYAKAGSNRYIMLRLSLLGGETRQWFDLQTGAVASQIGPSATASITDEGSGWYRCVLSANDTSTASQNVLFASTNTDALESGSVTSGNGTIIWGAQLEKGSTATPYQRNDSRLGGVATGSADDLHWLADDKVDDVMTAALPAMPTATVARATDDGVTIDYPVNIPAGSYSIDNNSTQGFEYGRIIVDRQLTAAEQTKLTEYLEGKS